MPMTKGFMSLTLCWIERGFSRGIRLADNLAKPYVSKTSMEKERKAHGAIEMLTTGFPDQYSTVLVSPRRRAVISARLAVEYRWY